MARVHVEVEGGGDGGVAEDGGNGFVVAVALDAAGSEAVAQRMKAYGRDVQPPQQPGEVIAVVARFQWGGRVRNHKILRVDDLPQRAQNRGQGPGDGDVPHGCRSLGRADAQRILPLTAVRKPHSRNGLAHANLPRTGVDILPLQRADFTDPKPAVEADEDPQVAKGEVFLQMPDQPLLPVECKNRHPAQRHRPGGEIHAEVEVLPEAQALAVAVDHLQNQDRILHRLGRQPLAQKAVGIRLHILAAYRHAAP